MPDKSRRSGESYADWQRRIGKKKATVLPELGEGDPAWVQQPSVESMPNVTGSQPNQFQLPDTDEFDPRFLPRVPTPMPTREPQVSDALPDTDEFDPRFDPPLGKNLAPPSDTQWVETEPGSGIFEERPVTDPVYGPSAPKPPEEDLSWLKDMEPPGGRRGYSGTAWTNEQTLTYLTKRGLLAPEDMRKFLTDTSFRQRVYNSAFARIEEDFPGMRATHGALTGAVVSIDRMNAFEDFPDVGNQAAVDALIAKFGGVVGAEGQPIIDPTLSGALADSFAPPGVTTFEQGMTPEEKWQGRSAADMIAGLAGTEEKPAPTYEEATAAFAAWHQASGRSLTVEEVAASPALQIIQRRLKGDDKDTTLYGFPSAEDVVTPEVGVFDEAALTVYSTTLEGASAVWKIPTIDPDNPQAAIDALNTVLDTGIPPLPGFSAELVDGQWLDSATGEPLTSEQAQAARLREGYQEDYDYFRGEVFPKAMELVQDALENKRAKEADDQFWQELQTPDIDSLREYTFRKEEQEKEDARLAELLPAISMLIPLLADPSTRGLVQSMPILVQLAQKLGIDFDNLPTAKGRDQAIEMLSPVLKNLVGKSYDEMKRVLDPIAASLHWPLEQLFGLITELQGGAQFAGAGTIGVTTTTVRRQ